MEKNDNNDEIIMTAAELLRKKNKKRKKKEKKEKKETTKLDGQHSSTTKKKRQHEDNDNKPKEINEDDLDDAIKRLEATLNQEFDNDNDSFENSSNNNNNNNDDYDDDNLARNDLVLRSSLLLDATVQIEGLKDEHLPKMKRRKLKGIDSDWKSDGTNAPNKNKTNTNHRKKRARNNTVCHGVVIDQSIRDQVNKILESYIPGVKRGVPFYCRTCDKQYNNEESFLRHRSDVFHIAAVQIEKENTYCTICCKQLTSIAQFNDHIQSRPHQDKVNGTRTILKSDIITNYCRWCQKQYDSQESYAQHKFTIDHRDAERNGRQKSYCTDCNKQLTSPEQLEQHLQSRAHQLCLERKEGREKSLKSLTFGLK